MRGSSSKVWNGCVGSPRDRPEPGGASGPPASNGEKLTRWETGLPATTAPSGSILPPGSGRSRPSGALLHGSTHKSRYRRCRLTLRDADGDRASQVQHAVQDMDSDGNLSDTTLVLARAQSVANDLFVTLDGGLDSTAPVVAGCLLPAEPAFLAIHCRWRSRCVGSVSAVLLG